MTAYARNLWQHFKEDNLFRNSIYLMLTTGTMGVFGFFFWVICTHIYTPEQIGIGTTLISAMTLISFVSLLGFNSTFVRFLPTSEKRNEEINTGSILVMGAAALIAIVYILLIPRISPSLNIIRENIWYSIGFIVMVSLASMNSLTDSIFVAYRSAQYNLITDGLITSGTKLILPVIFIGFGSYGIFAASGLAASIGMIASVLFLVVTFKYRPRFKIDAESLKKVFHYSFTNYLANLFSIVPTLVLPIIIINHLGSAAAGYYYLAFMIINLLYTVAASVSQSLFAEGSYSENSLERLISHSLKILSVLMIPMGIILALFGPAVLHFFGKSYSAGGGNVIVILAIAAPAVAAYNLGGVLLRIRHHMYTLVFVNIVYASIISGLSLLWIDRGLVWVAVAWTVGNIMAACLSFLYMYIRPTFTSNMTNN